MVFCTYCGQSFTRDEHLERHILTHTNVKPFKCFTCHMSFARRDLLQRHYTVHGRDQNNQEGLPPTAMIPKSAGRTPIACSNCAKTKTKCDKKFPCSRCAGRNLRCTLRPTRRASKNVNRGAVPGDSTGSGDSSEAGNNNESQNASGGNSPSGPSGDAQTQQPNMQSSPPQSEGQQSSNGQQPQQLAQSSPPPHSRNPSLSQPSALQIPTPEEKPLSIPISNSPPFFDQSPPNGMATLPNMLSPLPTPVNGFISQTPMSGYEDFIRTVPDSSDNDGSPRFLIDPWSTMSMAPEFEAMRVDPSIMMSMNMDINMGPPTDGILGMIPEMTPPQSFGPVQTPIHTPRMDESFSDLQIGSSASIFYPNRHSSINDAGIPDLGAIIAAQDGWSVFRCTPIIASTSCPRTARLNLERLEQSLKNHELWSGWRPSWDEADMQHEFVSVMQLHEATRDKLLAITQSFLHKALDIHKDGTGSSPTSGESPGSTASNFILLPPARVLECFLRAYANSFERFYPTSSRGILDPNELMMEYNDKASSLLILMMIAQGAVAIPSLEARWLTGGLTEACRISLFDLVEKNIIMASDPVVLRAALLFTVQAAWSGDKWQMDIAMGQRGMYFAMLRHSGILDDRHESTSHMNGATTESLWRDWIGVESKNRLIYSWVMVDQDLALFHDTAPLFSVTEFGAPMPDSDCLWQAKSATEWSELFSQVHQFKDRYSSVGSGVRPLSLKDLFRHFLDDTIVSQDIRLTPMHLRLLLHPLQTLVCQYCQLLSCFSTDSIGTRKGSRAVTAASTRVRLEEVQSLLQRWYDLAERHIKSSGMCPLMQANLIMFHLISLNAITNFSEIERVARREGVDGTYSQISAMHQRCISDVQEAVYHCGQVLRLIREMSRSIRPPWWPGAVYRVALILWLDALAQKESMSPNQQHQYHQSTFAIDALPAEHPIIARYLNRREGIPMLSKLDGTLVPIDHCFSVLSHCIDVVDEGLATRFSDGIRGKLEKLARG